MELSRRTLFDWASGMAGASALGGSRAEAAEAQGPAFTPFGGGAARSMEEVLQEVVVKDVATRQTVTATPVPEGVAWLRTMGGTSIGDGGEALYRRVAIEPDHPGKLMSKDGAWWELTNKIVRLEMFGGAPDCDLAGEFPKFAYASGTDNYQPFLDALAYLRAINTKAGGASGKIELLLGRYWVSRGINLHQRVMIVGQNAGGTANAAHYSTELVFPEEMTGFYINRHNTHGEDSGRGRGGGADGSFLGFLALRSLGGRDRLKHGIRWRARAVTQEVSIINFPGNGHEIVATQRSSEEYGKGNANYWRIYGGRIERCQHGINVEGADVNGGMAIGVEVNRNRGFGFRDGSFLGCDWYGCGSDGNGTMAGAWYDGNRYYARTGDLALLRSTQPGTNESVWGFWKAGPSDRFRYREWSEGNETDWLQGGAFACLDDNSRSVVVGGYLGEPNQFPAVLTDRNVSIGGYRAAGVVGDGPRLSTTSLTGLTKIRSERLQAVYPNGGVAELISIYNSGSKSEGRGSAIGLYAGQMADEETPRPAGQINARCIGKTVNGTVMSFGVLSSDKPDTLVGALHLNGQEKTQAPGADLAWSLGAAARRYLKGWFGNISLFPGSSVTPAMNGEVNFELTSDTELTFKVRGSDGTVRRGSITLS